MSSYKQKFNKKYGFSLNEPHNLNEISKITKVKKSILQQVFNRGVGAHKSNIASVRLKSGKKNYKILDPSKKMTAEQALHDIGWIELTCIAKVLRPVYKSIYFDEICIKSSIFVLFWPSSVLNKEISQSLFK